MVYYLLNEGIQGMNRFRATTMVPFSRDFCWRKNKKNGVFEIFVGERIRKMAFLLLHTFAFSCLRKAFGKVH